MKSFAALCTVREGKLKLYDRQGFDRALAQFGDGEDLELSISVPERKRTGPQNRFWHGVVIPAFADHCGYRVEEMKEVLSLQLIPVTVRGFDGHETVIPGHTADLTVEQFNDLIERAQQLGAEMDIYIPDPESAAVRRSS